MALPTIQLRPCYDGSVVYPVFVGTPPVLPSLNPCCAVRPCSEYPTTEGETFVADFELPSCLLPFDYLIGTFPAGTYVIRYCQGAFRYTGIPADGSWAVVLANNGLRRDDHSVIVTLPVSVFGPSDHAPLAATPPTAPRWTESGLVVRPTFPTSPPDYVIADVAFNAKQADAERAACAWLEDEFTHTGGEIYYHFEDVNSVNFVYPDNGNGFDPAETEANGSQKNPSFRIWRIA